MAIVSYNPSNYPTERDNSYWRRILPRQDKKTQIVEALEWQSLINKQVERGFSNFYNYYSIVRGLRVFVVNFNENDYNIILEGGQVYIETQYGAFFVDIDSENLTISNQERTFIGVEFDFLDDQDNVQHRNPHTGGAAFGDDGSNRLLLSYAITAGANPTNSYPIAVVTPSYFEVNEANGTCDVDYDVSVVINYTTNAGGTQVFQHVPAGSPYTLTGPIEGGWIYAAPSESDPEYRKRWGIKHNGTILDNGILALPDLKHIVSVDVTSVLSNPGVDSNYCPTINRIYPQPVIKYYKNERFTTDRSEGVIPTAMLNMVSQRIFESAGDFIDRGLEVTRLKQFGSGEDVDQNQLLIKVSPGVAYIQGRRIELQYPVVLTLPTFPINTTTFTASTPYNKFLIYLTENGDVDYLMEEDNQTYTFELPPHSIDLAQLDLYNYIEPTSNFWRFVITNSKKVMPTVLEMISLAEQHEEDKRKLATASLDLQTLGRTGPLSNTLSGIFTDSFTSLNKSNINSPLFTAAIIPSIQAVRPNFTIFSKDYTNFTVNPVSNTQLVFDDRESATLATINFSEEVIIENDPVSSSIVLGSTTGNVGVAVATPNVIYKRIDFPVCGCIAYTDPRTGKSNNVTFPAVNPMRADEQAKISDTALAAVNKPQIAAKPPVINIPDLGLDAKMPEGQKITLRVTQLSSNLDNLQLLFGNQFISNFEIIEGTEGASFGSVKATASGNATVEFSLPEGLTDERYTVALTNNRTTAAAEIKIVDPIKQRTLRDIISTPQFGTPPGGFPVITQPPCPTGLISGIAQSFLVEEPMTITGASVKIKTIGELSGEGRVLYITLVRMNGGIPTTEALAHGYLKSTNVNPSIFGEQWSRVTFDRPAQVSIAGEYAIVVTSAFSTVELFFGEVGQLSLSRIFEPQYTSIPVRTDQEQDSPLLKNFTNGTMFVAELATEIGEVNRWRQDNNRDLGFQIYRAVPGTITAELDFQVENDEEFNEVEVFAPIYCPAGNFVQLFIKDGNTFKLANTGHLHLNSSTTSTTVKLKFGGNPNLFCMLDITHTKINLFKNANKGTWVSIQTEFENPYTNVEFSFEYYVGDGDTITPYFSSDSGLTWEELDLLAVELIDGNTPLLKATYEKTDLNPIISLGGVNQLRTKLMMRLDFTAVDVNIMPYAKRVAVITY